MCFRQRCKALIASLAVAVLLLLPDVAPAEDEGWNPLVARLAADGVDEAYLRETFARPEVAFMPEAMASKLGAMLRRRAEGPQAPGEGGLHKSFLQPQVIGMARNFMRDNAATLDQLEARFGVEREVVVAIMLVETKFGEYVGTRSAFNTLASMARSSELEEVRPWLAPYLGRNSMTPADEEFARQALKDRSDWAYAEFKSLFEYARQSGTDPLGIRGSVYGAIGLCQFMPSNAMIYGVDADGDGTIDLFSTADALQSIACYLRGHGWRPGLDMAGRRAAVFTYNHSQTYVNTVLAVAERLSEPDAPLKSKVRAGRERKGRAVGPGI